MNYDDSGKLTTMTDSLGNETELSHASNGIIKEYISTYQYDSAGNVVEAINTIGQLQLMNKTSGTTAPGKIKLKRIL